MVKERLISVLYVSCVCISRVRVLFFNCFTLSTLWKTKTVRHFPVAVVCAHCQMLDSVTLAISSSKIKYQKWHFWRNDFLPKKWIEVGCRTKNSKQLKSYFKELFISWAQICSKFYLISQWNVCQWYAS